MGESFIPSTGFARPRSKRWKRWMKELRRTPPDSVRTTPPACPPDARLGPPDFVGVGAQRCGTSWWFGLLRAHPECDIRSIKEIHYFDRFWRESFDEADVDGYYRYFPRKAGLRSGEWTPRYMLDPWTPPLLHQAAPDASLLVMVRDPLERYVSGLTHYLSRRGPLDPTIADIAFERGLYAKQLTHLMRSFDGRRVLVLQLERCIRSPETELATTFDFLDLAPIDPVHLGLQTSGDRTPRPTLRIDDATRARLIQNYEQDVLDLPEIADRIDLGMWPNFSHLSTKIAAGSVAASARSADP
jgi:hypothetical protein